MIRFIVFVWVVISSCRTKEPVDLKQAVKEFDSKNSTAIISICDSLIQSLGTKTDYVMKLLPDNEEERFLEIDTSGQLGSHFKTYFMPTYSQLQFLIEAGATQISHYNKGEIFFSKLKSYKLGDKTITMYIYYGSKKLSNKKTPFFEKGNRKYILSNDKRSE